MKTFEYMRSGDYREASEYIKNSSENVEVISGGTDFLNNWRDQILPEYPDKIIQIDKAEGADSFEKTADGYSIGAETKLSVIADQEDIPVLAKAAGQIASEQIRNQATIAGDIFQDVRCRYYHYTDFMGGCVTCSRKGGDFCCAMHGDGPHHSIFGGMHTHVTPCSQGCPLGTDIPAYAEQIRKGNIDKAAHILMEANPFPMLLSRVCSHPCEAKCNQGKFGESVSIHNMERFLGDYILMHMDEFYKAPEKESGRCVAVVGGGPSGLSAAYFLRKEGHAVTVIERNELAGGVMRYGIPHYRLPKQYLDEVVDALGKMGVNFMMNTEVGKDIKPEELLEKYDYVYLGTGAWKQPVLGIGNEEVAEFGLNFLQGVAKFLRKNIDGQVLVCGGGNVAMDAALTAVRLGASKVSIMCLEQEYEMPASAEEIARCREEGIEINCGWGLKDIVTDDDGKPAGMMGMRCLSVYDENHRFSPEYSENDTKLFPASTIILATGQRVDISYLGEDLMSKLASPRGLIGTDLKTGETVNPRIYAGGDAASGPNIASQAAAGGRNAAFAICSAISGDEEKDDKACEEPSEALFTTIDTEGIKLTQACHEKNRPVKDRSLYEEDADTLEPDEILREAGRCMNCSCFAVENSDLAPILLLMDAEFVTTERRISAKELLTTKKSAKEVLKPGEILTRIDIPKQKYDSLFYDKEAQDPGHDFSHVSLAAGISASDGVVKNAKFIFGGVAGIPYEAKAAEEYLTGKTLSYETIEEAASRAVEGACAFPENRERVWDMKRLLRRALKTVSVR